MRVITTGVLLHAPKLAPIIEYPYAIIKVPVITGHLAHRNGKQLHVGIVRRRGYRRRCKHCARNQSRPDLFGYVVAREQNDDKLTIKITAPDGTENICELTLIEYEGNYNWGFITSRSCNHLPN